MLTIRVAFLLAALACPCCHTMAQPQIADTAYRPPVFTARYPAGAGPQLWIDEAHYNFHTADGRYAPFARVLSLDGYRVERHGAEFSTSSLTGKRLLVVANALHHTNADNWDPPNYSAFTDAEIEALRTWVANGGSLFLIADHMPFAGAAAELAAAFGFRFHNCFAMDSANRNGPDFFTRRASGFIPGPLAGLDGVDTIVSFTGQGFDVPKEAQSILALDERFHLLFPKRPWQFRRDMRIELAVGKSAGALMKYGKGRVVMWGEAAMFSAQLAGVDKMGMNTEAARSNYRLLLSLVHWLDGEKQ